MRGLAGMTLYALLGVPAVWADIPVSITATIIEPACSVTDASGSSQMEVDFKEVLLDSIGTGGKIGTATTPVMMKVTCDGNAPSGKTLKMYINPTGGTMSYAGRTVLGTSVTGLGIDLLDEQTSSLPLSTWTPVVLNGGFAIASAALVSENVTDMKGGFFTSTASVVVAYL
ncbi:fimbrial protein [Salmonella enterica subsp. enterica serovar Abaetetuba]|nr:fimbrial protein [Salmonella enterica subsp. enterica serovar Abaetetuba]ECC6794395.1 fimbrial protein [Salmonella enterica]ECD1969208.1 fimbrial protein [Salmonella enterica subsp. enterica serovar Abaetetuba]EJR4301104.1 fimbrial protein [Salmonella enterica]EJR4403541.1 fimbrial protein [Salmonella enterica]